MSLLPQIAVCDLKRAVGRSVASLIEQQLLLCQLVALRVAQLLWESLYFAVLRDAKDLLHEVRRLCRP